VEQRKDWPLGPALKQRRIDKGLSVRGAAALTRKVVSETRWRQLESGFQSIPGGIAPINTTIRTVVAAAKAVDWSPREAAKLAGFDPKDAGPERATPGTMTATLESLEALEEIVLIRELARRLGWRLAPMDETEAGDWALIEPMRDRTEDEEQPKNFGEQ
jgi:hypothetical protein